MESKEQLGSYSLAHMRHGNRVGTVEEGIKDLTYEEVNNHVVDSPYMI